MYKLCALMFVMLFTFVGCAGSNFEASLNGDTATPYHIHYDASVHLGRAQLYVQPNVSPSGALRGLFVPLRMTQNINRSRELSRNLSRQIWQVWLSQQAFAALEYDDSVLPYKPSDALGLARARGANVLVGGYITHYLDSGSVGDSAVSIHMEVYDVATGNLLWSIAQGGSMDKAQAQDYFIVGVQSRLPVDAVSVITSHVAHDIGNYIARWVKPTGAKGSPFEGNTF